MQRDGMDDWRYGAPWNNSSRVLLSLTRIGDYFPLLLSLARESMASWRTISLQLQLVIRAANVAPWVQNAKRFFAFAPG
jgi:hypothetical protein